MKKNISLFAVMLLCVVIYGQDNSYFGSFVVQKDIYYVRVSSSDLYWSVFDENIKLNSIGNSAEILFIPAGRGYYYIKFINNNKYLSVISDDNMLAIQIKPFSKQKNQQFKIIETCKAGFSFISFDGFLLVYRNNKLSLQKDNKLNTCSFEIVKSKTLSKIGTY